MAVATCVLGLLRWPWSLCVRPADRTPCWGRSERPIILHPWRTWSVITQLQVGGLMSETVTGHGGSAANCVDWWVKSRSTPNSARTLHKPRPELHLDFNQLHPKPHRRLPKRFLDLHPTLNSAWPPPNLCPKLLPNLHPKSGRTLHELHPTLLPKFHLTSARTLARPAPQFARTLHQTAPQSASTLSELNPNCSQSPSQPLLRDVRQSGL